MNRKWHVWCHTPNITVHFSEQLHSSIKTVWEIWSSSSNMTSPLTSQTNTQWCVQVPFLKIYRSRNRKTGSSDPGPGRTPLSACLSVCLPAAVEDVPGASPLQSLQLIGRQLGAAVGQRAEGSIRQDDHHHPCWRTHTQHTTVCCTAAETHIHLINDQS